MALPIPKTIRFAELEDIPTLLEMGSKLHSESCYKEIPFDPKQVRYNLERFIISDRAGFLPLVSINDEGTVVGCLFAYAFNTFFSHERVCAEVLLYLEPEYRKGRRGLELMEAYEYWAKLVGCAVAQYGSVSSDKRLETLYTKRGLVPYEKVYIKKLRG